MKGSEYLLEPPTMIEFLLFVQRNRTCGKDCQSPGRKAGSLLLGAGFLGRRSVF